MNNDKQYMHRALELARKAQGKTLPNPMVGCVIIKGGKVVGEGYHKKAGKPHAEVEALKKAGTKAKGSTLYVTLEPCSHFGKTPPCADAIIKAGVKKVVAAMKDPNPLVAGKGFAKLKRAGITVETGVLKSGAEKLNEIFIKNVTQKMPYVIMKAGISLDGKIALKNGDSKWITSAAARKYSQELRRDNDAIMVGIGTVLKDNPSLGHRVNSKLKTQNTKPATKNTKLKKVVLDYYGKTPANAKLFKGTKAEDVIILYRKIPNTKYQVLSKKGATLIMCKGSNGKLDERDVLKKLNKNGICTVVLEGGSNAITSFIKKKLIDEVNLHISNKIIGNDGIPFVKELGLTKLSKSIKIKTSDIIVTEEDIIIKGTLDYNVKRKT